MLTKDIILKTLNSYNLNSHKYGPTIYENSNLGICLDIKDSIFGYLTRAFIFNEPNSLEEFIQKYLWYKNNYQKYPIKLVLTDYNHPETTIKYIYQEKELTLNEMQNLKENISLKKEDTKNNNLKTAYLLNIEALTNYLINLKNEHNNLKIEKNNLKIKENDLKYALLENLTIYYGKTRPIEKKGVSLDNIINSNSENTLLQNNLTNIKNKELPAIEDYLKVLINLVKEEELNNQSLINTYSNNIYKYNISILNKQIEFVKSKIEAEKNFNLKGSKIHNIDDELKSFLKNSPTPLKVNEYIEENQTKIKAKYQDLTNLSLAYTKITGNPLNIPEIIDEKITELAPSYNNLPLDIKMKIIITILSSILNL